MVSAPPRTRTIPAESAGPVGAGKSEMWHTEFIEMNAARQRLSNRDLRGRRSTIARMTLTVTALPRHL